MVSDPENPLVLSVLKASSTAYSYKPDEKIDQVRLPVCLGGYIKNKRLQVKEAETKIY